MRTQAASSGTLSYWFNWFVRSLTRPFRRETEDRVVHYVEDLGQKTPEALKSMYLEQIREQEELRNSNPTMHPPEVLRADGTRIDLQTLRSRVEDKEIANLQDAIMDQPSAAPPPNRNDISIRKKSPWAKD